MGLRIQVPQRGHPCSNKHRRSTVSRPCLNWFNIGLHCQNMLHLEQPHTCDCIVQEYQGQWGGKADQCTAYHLYA